ncbi:YkgJ family cysteine cluster protein [Zymomonas mobilis]|uniref:YkgJ family cysteine cluster protein n=1 Tax=Zymomonas mobilis TaxID=542 RepID=UPI0039E943E2
MLEPEFPCSRCGACCRHVYRAEETRFLNRGDGICGHYDINSKLCSIYETRPLICRVQKQFYLNYKDQFTWNEFIELNQMACRILEALD